MLKLQFVDVVNDYLVFCVLLIFLINEGHEIYLLALIVDLYES